MDSSASESYGTTPATSISSDEDRPNSKSTKPSDLDLATTNADREGHGDTDHEPEKPIKIDKLKEDLESESESDTSDLDEASGDYLIRNLAGSVSSQQLFNLYTKNLEKKAKKKGSGDNNEGSNLVKGLVDYLRVLEDRVGQLETNAGTKAVEELDENLKSPWLGDFTVEVAVKFFNCAAYLEEDGSFPKILKEPEKRSFMCGDDDQHLLRVLYSRVAGAAGAKPRKQADTVPPRPVDVDILTFGVTSEAVSAFFTDQLGLDRALGDGPLRMGKPFRPLIRNVSRLREQVKKLEQRYGNDARESAGGFAFPIMARGISYEASSPSLAHGDGLPFAPTGNHDDEDAQPYDKASALPHFQTFMAFVNEYFGNQIELYERLRNGKEKHVAFENLWMLFDVNDTIYCPEREENAEYANVEGPDHTPNKRYTPQAYRVVATSGGLPLWRTLVSKKGKAKDSASPTSLSDSLINKGGKAGVEATIADILAQSVKTSRQIRNNYTEFHVYCFYVDFDGFDYGMVREAFVIKPYGRKMDILDLPVYPARFSDDNDLSVRGERFIMATKPTHMQYEGLTVGLNHEEINSPVIVDIKLAYENGPETAKASIQIPEFDSVESLWLAHPPGATYDLYGRSTCSHWWCYSRDCTSDADIESQKRKRPRIDSEIRTILEEYENLKKGADQGLERFKQFMEEKDLIRLLPGTVWGFALRNRKWVLLNLMQLGPVEQNNEWDKLVLPEGHRQMVQAMVETHTQESGSDKDSRIGMDFVKGKGRGCIILLHGVPGVGKTSTAECVAAHTNKPLYPITCGDIGYRPEDVEKNMENHFRLAHKWGCVLLLDEADVFLAKRDQRDVERNGLVSVFLRILEYYSGILFLTTNRVGAIDDAFRSRLHLTLYYPRLTKKQTKEVFKRNFDRIAEVNADREADKLVKFEYEESDKAKIMDWAKETYKTLRWNGRQIRNAFQTVLALAEFEAKSKDRPTNPVVTKKHFKIVAKASTQFTEYLQATHGFEEEMNAHRDKTRTASYQPPSALVFKGFDNESSDSSTAEDDDSSSDDDSDESPTGKKKKKTKASKEKEAKSKKGKKGSDKKGKSDKKAKAQKKEKRGDKDTDDDEESSD